MVERTVFPPNREQLEAITGGDPDAIRKLEDLFRTAGELTPSEVGDVVDALAAHLADLANPHDTSYDNLLLREPQDGGVYGRNSNAWEEVAPLVAFQSHLADLDNPHETSWGNLNDIPATFPPDPHTLPFHSDVTVTAPAHRESLVYDADATQWVNGDGIHQFTEANPTGLVNGGEVNSGIAVDDVEIGAGLGVVLDSYTTPDERPVSVLVDWPLINEPITAAAGVAGSIVYLTIYNTGVASTPINHAPVYVGALRQRATYPNPEAMRDELFLGVMLHTGDGWNDVSFPKVLNNVAESLYDMMNTVTGPMFVIDGGGVNEAPGFTLNQEAGTIWQMNRNWQNNHKDPHREGIASVTGIQWRYTNRDFTDVSALTSTIDSGTWDNAGTVEAVPGTANRATIQRLYQDVDDNLWIEWGQNIYDNAQEAASRINSPVVLPPLLTSSFLLGYIVAEKGHSDWDKDETFFIAGGAAGTGTTNVPITNHNDLLLRDAIDAHPVTAIELMTGVLPTAVGDGIVWTGAAWESLNLWVAAGYGGIRQSGPVALADITAGRTTLVADEVSITSPRGVTQDAATNTITFNVAGVWSVAIGVSLTHNETNGSRTFGIRLYNETDAVGSPDTVIGVGRNTDTTTFSTVSLVEILPGETGGAWHVEVGAASTDVTDVTENSFTFSANLVSEYRG